MFNVDSLSGGDPVYGNDHEDNGLQDNGHMSK